MKGRISRKSPIKRLFRPCGNRTISFLKSYARVSSDETLRGQSWVGLDECEEVDGGPPSGPKKKKLGMEGDQKRVRQGDGPCGKQKREKR